MSIRRYGELGVLSAGECRHAAEWALKKLLGPEAARVRLSIRVHDPIKKPSVHLSDDDWAAVVFFRRDPDRATVYLHHRLKTRPQALRAMFHELVHVKQVMKKEWDGGFIDARPSIWKKKAVDPGKIGYCSRPWEVEARAREHKLYRAYRRYLKKEGLTFL